MSRFLLIDIGAGTMDVLYYNSRSELNYKAVVKSPVQLIAEKAASMQGNIAVTGCEMGGGPITRILKEKAIKNEIVMSVSSAATLHHDVNKVKSWGIKLITDEEMDDYCQDKQNGTIKLQDLDIKRIKNIIKGFGLPFDFDVMGVCAQDHGIPPNGESHLDYRHKMFTSILDKTPLPEALLYKNDHVPESMGRLSSIAKSANEFPAKDIYIMDSGMAAILGASMDPMIKSQKTKFLLDVATSHTIGAVFEGHLIGGFFEYHTSDISLNRLEELIKDLAEGNLTHENILHEGGHGAYIRKTIGIDSLETVLATGPKRKLIQGSQMPIVNGAPLGDNMMTGTVGLLEAIRRRQKLEAINYI